MKNILPVGARWLPSTVRMHTNDIEARRLSVSAALPSDIPGLAVHRGYLGDREFSDEYLTIAHVATGHAVVKCVPAWDRRLLDAVLAILARVPDWTRSGESIHADVPMRNRMMDVVEEARELLGILETINREHGVVESARTSVPS